MQTKKIILGGAAAVALAGALSLGSAPVLAQQAQPAQPDQTEPSSSQDNGLYGSQVNPPQYSTPAEKQQTRTLNNQGVNGTTTSPAVLNGEAPAANNAVQTQPSQAPNPPQSDEPAPPPGPQASNVRPMQLAQYMPPQNGSDAQQQYDQQQQQYQDQQQEYENQKQRYNDQQHRYYHNLRQYDQARWEYDYPHAFAYRYEGAHLQRLYLIAEPTQQLADVPVEGPNGRWVGRVRNVDTGPDGRPARIEIALNRRVSVWVRPGDFRFDPYNRVLFTDLTRENLWDMPGATVESGPL